MDQPTKVTNIKNERIDFASSDQVEISSGMQFNSMKQENFRLVQPEIYIKTEAQENKNEFSVIAGTSYHMCLDNIKVEMEEPLIKIEGEDLENEITQDPLDISSELKDEEYFPIDLDSESRIKTEPTEGKTDKNLLESDEDSDSHGKEPNSQDQLLIRNDLVHKDKKYVCNVCNNTFRWKCYLERHLQTHMEVKPYTCDVCDKSFYFKRALDRHMLIHSSEKPYSCDVCKKVFRYKSHLNDHKLVHSGVKSFLCQECNKSFSRKHDLVKHKRIHSGEKPYPCDECTKAFTDKSSLIRHKRLHTGEKCISCDVCNKSFADRSNFNKHKKIHMNL